MAEILPFSPSQIRFWGSRAAELFTLEISESFHGVLTKNMVSDPADPMAGFVSASIDGRPWTGTMWTRDAGVFLRELVMWGDLSHACLVARRLMNLVRKNEQGYCTFPVYFKLGQPGSGSELDGTCTILIGLALLCERLHEYHPLRRQIEQFVHGQASPLGYILKRLEQYPLIPGSGEFGGGCGVEGEFYNVVQNGLARYALLACARMGSQARTYRRGAEQISANLLRYMRDGDGGWLWAIDIDSLKPNPAVINDIFNKGFGGLNGVLSMWSDVLGLSPLESGWPGLEPCLRTFDGLFAAPKRRAMFEKYGIWTQFDDLWGGYYTSPSYGHCYAAQAMLLTDRLDMAGKAVDFLAEMTYQPLTGNKVERESAYYFYERCYLPELLDEWPELSGPGGSLPDWIKQGYLGDHFDEGCGALNLVNVAEPLKIARLILGIDDSDPSNVRWVPRLPPAWQGVEASRWPVLTTGGLVYVDLRCERDGGGLRMDVTPLDGKLAPINPCLPG